MIIRGFESNDFIHLRIRRCWAKSNDSADLHEDKPLL